MSDAPDSDRLKELGDRIDQMRGDMEPGPRADEHFSMANLAWRMVIELVAGLAIGFGIGYGLDALFGTRPFLMVLFIFLGFIAGVKTMMRTAIEVQQEQAANDAAKKD